jgi:hypothetical protein
VNWRIILKMNLREIERWWYGLDLSYGSVKGSGL